MPETLLFLLKLQNCPKTFEDFRTKKFIYMNYLSRSWKSQSKALWKCIILVCTSHRIWVHDQQKMEVFCSFFFTNLKILLIKSCNFSIFQSKFLMYRSWAFWNGITLGSYHAPNLGTLAQAFCNTVSCDYVFIRHLV